jgi:hypothetical protein
MTTALVGGLLGLFGTALGAALTTLTVRQTAHRSERMAREEARRQEYRAAVIRFATALLAYRLAEINHWYSRHGRSQDQAGNVEKEVYGTRATAWNAFYELELSTSHEITDLARRAIDSTHAIRTEDSEDEMSRYAAQARDDLAAMIARARAAQPGEIPNMTVALSSS